MHSFLTILQRQLQQTPQVKRLIIGYSGGCDSHVLVHLLQCYRRPLKIKHLEAIHINHNLQPDANRWVEHCRNTCHDLHIPFESLTVDAAPNSGESPEAAARHARYRAFSQQVDEKTALLTAHHQDDQAETLLLQLLRGAGPRGLAAMPESSSLGKGYLWRPLLQCQRGSLIEYARKRQLNWIEDPSNRDDRFDRNFLRQNIMPLIKQRWPGCTNTLSRSAELCGESRHLLDGLADTDLTACLNPDQTLNLSSVITLPQPRQHNLIHRWLQRTGLPLPASRHYRELQQSIINAEQDAEPLLQWPGGEIRRFRNKLFALKPVPRLNNQIQWTITPGTPLTITGIGTLTLQKQPHSGLPLIRETNATLSIRLRRGGERFHPHWRRHSQTLKKLCQEKAIPPWERDRLPLLYAEQQLIAVPGLGIANDWLTDPGESGRQLVWNKMS